MFSVLIKFLGGFSLLYFLFISLFINLHSGDNSAFASQVVNFDFLVSRFNNWSSRLFIESLLVYLAKHDALFIFINGLILFITPYLIYKIKDNFNLDKQNILSLSCIFAIFFIYSYKYMGSAGFRATFLNYYYPFSALVIAVFFASLKKNFFTYLGFVIFTIFAINQELLAINVLLASFALILIYKKDISSYVVIAFILSLFMVVFAALCPGNNLRFAEEINNWLPEFKDYSIFYKCYLGILSTAHLYFMDRSTVFLFFIMVLIYALSKKLSFSFITAFFYYFTQKAFANFDKAYLFNYKFEFDYFAFFSLIYLIVSLCLILLALIKLEFEKQEKIIILIVIFSSFAARCAMGFSPTIFASAERTFLFLDFSLLLIAAFIILKIKPNAKALFWLLFIPCFRVVFSNLRI